MTDNSDRELNIALAINYEGSLDVHRAANLVGKCIEAETTCGSVTGRLHAIDPVSQTIILAKKNSESAADELALYPGHIVRSIALMRESNEPVYNLADWHCDGDRRVAYDRRKKAIVNWFTKSRICFEEEGDILRLNDVEIHPPYGIEDCLSCNPIVLARVQELLKNMDSLENR